jgi:hypothetical protein
MTGSDAGAFFGRLLLFAGILLAAVGLLLMLGPRLPYVGRLPGDVVWTRGNLRVYVPITTCLLLSLVLTLALWLIDRLRR